ncbi:MAG: hypothetical protein WB805_13055, partial [Candidatus Dormiibacterota bacterium]
MNAFASGLQNGGHRVLSEPVDLEVGMEPPQLISDRDVTLRVTEADGRRDVQRALAATRGGRPLGSALGRTGKVSDQQVHLDRLTCVGAMPRTLEADEGRAHELGENSSGLMGTDGVVGSMNDERRTLDASDQVAEQRLVELRTRGRGDERFRRCLLPPSHGILDLFGRVRIREHMRHEEVEEALVVLQPVVPVELEPSLVWRTPLVKCRHRLGAAELREERHG